MKKISTQTLTAIFYLVIFIAMNSHAQEKPKDFIYLKGSIPSIQEDMRYTTDDNFVGRPINGYKKSVCILTIPTAKALLKIQTALKKENLGLRIFDCYRPQRAVDDFVQWSQDSNDQKMKHAYYPHINKADLFKLNYMAYQSGHTRGSTVDLTLVDLKTNQPLDMGTHFDYMDPLSYPSNRDITEKQFKNRMLLQKFMLAFDFIPLKTEWWHFTLRNEPYKNSYFNFLVQ